ncbi:lyase family protein [Fructobacillus sp. W13]|uniref:Lyase family protein n=1 Tax=Fructobacillus apis TaxID=2935017 RepID=A0ABT0ZPF4_9LACO|nr:lyase family protein [Fructobacillus apis]MCO0831875.1 lyase family protein [Fructobacillus apis]
MNTTIETGHPLDDAIIGGNFTTPEMKTIWSSQNRLRQQFIVEKGLAKVEAALGMIPASAGQAIQALTFDQLSLANIQRVSSQSQHSLLGLIQNMQTEAGASGEFVHYGATTQDIVDTGMVLQIKSSISLMQKRLSNINQTLGQLSEKYKRTKIVAHTHGVQAVPSTYGFQLIRYYDELTRQQKRLTQAEDDVLVGNLADAVGSHSALGKDGIEVEKALMEELGLKRTPIAFHASPDRIVHYTSALTILSAQLGKMAKNFFHQAGNEVGEISESYVGQVGSSTMPHKQNPEQLEAVMALVEPVFQAQNLLQHSLLSLGERDAVSWKMLWLALPEIHQYVDRQLSLMEGLLPTLQAHLDRMAENAEVMGDFLYSENLMMVLGKKLGKQTAHHIIHEAAMQAMAGGLDFISHIANQEEVPYTVEELRMKINHEQVTEAIPVLIDEVLGGK